MEHTGGPLDEVLPVMHSLFHGTFKQLFNKAEADVTRSTDKAGKLLEIASQPGRVGAFSNPLKDRNEGQGGFLEKGLNRLQEGLQAAGYPSEGQARGEMPGLRLLCLRLTR